MRRRNLNVEYFRTSEEREMRENKRLKLIQDTFLIDQENFFKDFPKRFEIKNAT